MFYLLLAAAAYAGYWFGKRQVKLDPRVEFLAQELARQDELAKAESAKKTREALIKSLQPSAPVPPAA